MSPTVDRSVTVVVLNAGNALRADRPGGVHRAAQDAAAARLVRGGIGRVPEGSVDRLSPLAINVTMLRLEYD